jgi:hypothetical protein
MSAKERREHLERALSEGGSIMNARGGVTRTVPSTSAFARTPAEKQAARDDIERRARALQEEAELLEGGDEGLGDDSSAGETELSSRTVVELREMAKERGVEGYSTLKKDELIAAISERA